MTARVLVVDDILPNVKLLEAKLMAEYYEVVTALNGPEALKKIVECNPDVVLLDVMMPGMDGFEVCRQIKANPLTAHIPVVMVTALTDVEDRVRGLENGADDFLSKPVNDVALMARVRSLVRLKMTIDEWRARESTASQLGVTDEALTVMTQPVEQAQILVLEDMAFDANRIVDAMGRDQNAVSVVTSGMDALKEIAVKDFDLIFLSLNLKNEDGARFCAHLRSNERSRSTPIVMLGNDTDLEKIAHCLEIGAHDYILRPLDRNEMLARCRTQIRRKRFQDKLRANYEISLSMALTDALTGLYNRRYFEVHMQKMLQTARENHKPLGFLYIDIDHFKPVNDTHGHQVGDEILKGFAARIKDGVRSFDLVARLGGEEFVAILPDTTEEVACLIAERLRRVVADTPFPCSAKDGQLSITASFGGIVLSDGQAEQMDVGALIQRADAQLYEAKNNGRNCIYFDGKGRLSTPTS
ncbi:MAG TPA: PleD family two-component system response regulator [Alphaproteobacteria bacterium]|nr:PleD family two-component system response regulator [Alphaproteobacteria bacterium]MCB9985231.1 PleD family two-component system response regulator [Micavibrio sp.]HRK98688.1 PleD family two-component system response regulator [Alphaproteobacteria bacterium]